MSETQSRPIRARFDTRKRKITHDGRERILRIPHVPAAFKWILIFFFVIGISEIRLVIGMLQAETVHPGGTVNKKNHRAQLAVPQPDLSRLEAAIRQRLTREGDELKDLVRQAETTDDQLAEAFGEMGRLYHAHYL